MNTEELQTMPDQLSPDSPEKNSSRERVEKAVVAQIDHILERDYAREPYHNPGHSKGVAERTEDSLNMVQAIDPTLVTDDERLAARLAAKGHDLVVKFEINSTTGMRMRHRGFEASDIPKGLAAKVGNERASADEVLEMIDKEDPEKAIIGAPIRSLVKEGIAATFPEVGMEALSQADVLIADPVTGDAIDLTEYLGKDKDGRPTRVALKFSQKYLTAKSSLVALSVALADLSQVGRVTPEEFDKGGDAEFRELNEYITRDLKSGITNLSSERKAEIAKKMIAWHKDQIGFGLWQKVRFAELIDANEIINGSPFAQKIKEAFHKKYSHFDENILVTVRRFDSAQSKYQKLTDPGSFPENDSLFVELTRELGYSN